MEFFGRSYLYPTPNDGTVTIGVCRAMGGSEWMVGYRRPGRSGTRRIKTNHLPVMGDPAQLQSNLNAWAATRKLQEVA
jgi:hypothetical protein